MQVIRRNALGTELVAVTAARQVILDTELHLAQVVEQSRGYAEHLLDGLETVAAEIDRSGDVLIGTQALHIAHHSQHLQLLAVLGGNEVHRTRKRGVLVGNAVGLGTANGIAAIQLHVLAALGVGTLGLDLEAALGVLQENEGVESRKPLIVLLARRSIVAILRTDGKHARAHAAQETAVFVGNAGIDFRDGMALVFVRAAGRASGTVLELFQDTGRKRQLLIEGGIEHDTAALILSTFKKIVNKQQISGGSAVQVSAFGIEGYSVDGGLRAVTDPDDPANVLYAEIEMPFDKSFMLETRTADGTVTKNPVSLDYDRYCNPDGTLIPTGDPIKKEGKDGKTSREWKKYQSYTYKNVNGKLVPCRHDDPEAEVYKPLIEEEYPDILSILAYRIPTERDYSMMNCQIKRFTRKTAGGTLKVPPQWTTIAGFDFDIDKLYFMQREYHKHYKDTSYIESKFNDKQKDKIWAKVYKDYPEVSEALVAARNEAMLRDPDNHATSKTLPSGRILTRPKNPVNSYWEDAKISERYGLDKHAVFAQAAQQLGEKPSVNLVKGEVIEWMEEYDFKKPPEENTRASRNNLLITLIQARLMDPQTTKQRYTPGGFANASDAALRMRVLQFADVESITTNGVVDNAKVDALIAKIADKKDPLQDPEPNYDPTDPYTILVYNQQNQVAAKLIGIFANQNTNHAFASSMDMFELTEPIEFCGHSFKDLLHKGDADEAARIDLNMAEFLAASVDAVKDPVLNFLNLNLATADAGAVLARLGYTTREIGLLFNQPIIKKVCDETFNKGCNIKTAIKNARNDLLNGMTGIDPDAKYNIS